MKRTIITLSMATTALLAPAAAAHAATTAQHLTCPKPSVHFTQTGIASFTTTTSKPGCTVQLSSWAVPDTYDGKGYDASAKPQTLVDRTIATLTGTPQTVSVKVPSSRWCQIDFRAKGGTYLYGRIVECHPVATVTGGPPVVKPPKPKPKPKHHHTTPAARVRAVTPAALPAQLAMTASPYDLGTYELIGLGALAAGGILVALTILTSPARRFNRQGQR